MSIVDFTMTDVYTLVEMGTIYPHLGEMYARDIDVMARLIPQPFRDSVWQAKTLNEKANAMRDYFNSVKYH